MNWYIVYVYDKFMLVLFMYIDREIVLSDGYFEEDILFTYHTWHKWREGFDIPDCGGTDEEVRCGCCDFNE